jgi:hypothetical protein
MYASIRYDPVTGNTKRQNCHLCFISIVFIFVLQQWHSTVHGGICQHQASTLLQFILVVMTVGWELWIGIYISHFLNFCNIYYGKSTQVFQLHVNR